MIHGAPYVGFSHCSGTAEFVVIEQSQPKIDYLGGGLKESL